MKKLKIERPDWAMICEGEIYTYGIRCLDKWFNTHVEPLNKMIREGRTVYSEQAKLPWHNVEHTLCTHKALLIGIEPIKKWQCPCGEIAMFADTEDCRTPLCHGCAMEIKRALENRGQDEK